MPHTDGTKDRSPIKPPDENLRVLQHEALQTFRSNLSIPRRLRWVSARAERPLTAAALRPPSVLQERLDDVPDAEHPQVGVGLAGPDKVDRLARDIGHRQRGADL